jgi:hypothetical protein
MPKYTNYGEYLESMGLVLKDGASIFCLNPETDPRDQDLPVKKEISGFSKFGRCFKIDYHHWSKQFSSETMGSILRIAGGEFSTLRAKQMLSQGI